MKLKVISLVLIQAFMVLDFALGSIEGLDSTRDFNISSLAPECKIYRREFAINFSKLHSNTALLDDDLAWYGGRPRKIPAAQHIRYWPIGVFDSGLGGLNVVKELSSLMPSEDITFLADQKNFPFQSKSKDEIKEITANITEFLLSEGVKCVVAACGTASSVGEGVLNEYQTIPVIGIIDPVAEAAVKITQNKKIGVLGTVRTVESDAIGKAIKKLNSDIEVINSACPEFAKLIEEGKTESTQMREIALEYLTPLKSNGVDTVVLGCTHYNLIKDLIANLMGQKVKIIDSAEVIANKVKGILQDERLDIKEQRNPTIKYLFTEEKGNFVEIGRKLIGEDFDPALVTIKPKLPHAKAWWDFIGEVDELTLEINDDFRGLLLDFIPTSIIGNFAAERLKLIKESLKNKTIHRELTAYFIDFKDHIKQQLSAYYPEDVCYFDERYYDLVCEFVIAQIKSSIVPKSGIKTNDMKRIFRVSESLAKETEKRAKNLQDDLLLKNAICFWQFAWVVAIRYDTCSVREVKAIDRKLKRLETVRRKNINRKALTSIAKDFSTAPKKSLIDKSKQPTRLIEQAI